MSSPYNESYSKHCKENIHHVKFSKIGENTISAIYCLGIWCLTFSNPNVLGSPVHILKLERYREDQHGPCARMTRKIVKRSTFFGTARSYSSILVFINFELGSAWAQQIDILYFYQMTHGPIRSDARSNPVRVNPFFLLDISSFFAFTHRFSLGLS